MEALSLPRSTSPIMRRSASACLFTTSSTRTSCSGPSKAPVTRRRKPSPCRTSRAGYTCTPTRTASASPHRTTTCRRRNRRAKCASLSWAGRWSNWPARSTSRYRDRSGRILRERYRGRDIEVINAGIQSCVSRQSVAQLLFTVVDYHPDIVILYDGGNDLGLPLTYESRANFPYNFQTMQEAWDLYRQERQQPLWRWRSIAAICTACCARAYIPTSGRWYPPRTRRSPAATRSRPDGSCPTRITSRSHVAAYLSNWRKLIELSDAYHYRPVCVLSPAGDLSRRVRAAPALMKSFNMDRATAIQWLRAARTCSTRRPAARWRKCAPHTPTALFSRSVALPGPAGKVFLGPRPRLRRSQHGGGANESTKTSGRWWSVACARPGRCGLRVRVDVCAPPW